MATPASLSLSALAHVAPLTCKHHSTTSTIRCETNPASRRESEMASNTHCRAIPEWFQFEQLFMRTSMAISASSGISSAHGAARRTMPYSSSYPDPCGSMQSLCSKCTTRTAVRSRMAAWYAAPMSFALHNELASRMCRNCCLNCSNRSGRDKGWGALEVDTSLLSLERNVKELAGASLQLPCQHFFQTCRSHSFKAVYHVECMSLDGIVAFGVVTRRLSRAAAPLKSCIMGCRQATSGTS